MLHVPYKGTAGAVTDLLGGRIDYMFLPVHVALQQIQAGKLKAIAAGSDKRLPQLPDVPTLAEAGVASGNVDMWYGVLAPKGTPPEVVSRLNQEIAAALKHPSVATAFEAQGMVPASSSAGAIQGADDEGCGAVGGCGQEGPDHGVNRLAPQARALRVALHPPAGGHHLRPGGAGSVGVA